MKKALLLVSLLSFLSVTSLVFFASKTSAQANQNKNAVSRQTQNEKEAFNDKTNLKQTTYGVGEGTMSYILNQVAGCFSEECMEKSAYLGDGGAVGGVGRMISKTFLPVASTETYIADLLQNMNIAQPAYAQGLGFSALQPVLVLWKIFRDIAYVFFVFIFLIIGFAIMFRKNLGGQAAVTVQQALPRIIVALLAVSFSYAIAGLLIDFMWIAMYFLITMFGGAGLIKQDWVTNYEILNQNIFSVFGNIISSGIANNAGVVVGDLVSNMLNGSGALGDKIGEGIGWITGILGTLIVFIAILFAMFKTFFSLIKVYFEIIMTIIFAPVALMMGAINGNAFGNWLKSLIINLAVFPVLLVFIIIGYMLINVEGDRSLPQQLQKSGFIPPFVPGGTQANQIGLVGGIAAIMFLPEVVGFVTKNKPSSIFDEIAPKAFGQAMSGAPIGSTIGLGAGGAITGAGLGALAGAWQNRSLIKDPAVFARAVRDRSLRGAGNFAARGGSFGNSAAQSLGGKTPGFASPLEKFTSSASGYLSDENRLKRISEGRGDLAFNFGLNRQEDLRDFEMRKRDAAAQAKIDAELRKRQREWKPGQDLPFPGYAPGKKDH